MKWAVKKFKKSLTIKKKIRRKLTYNRHKLTLKYLP